jgi:3-hydroxybutyrate dehydrogenase
MSNSLEGKHALIAGGSGEMGYQAARALLAEGAKVTLLARGSEGLTTAATRLINEIDGDVLTVTADLAQPRTLDRALDHAISSFGNIDILVLALRDDVEGGFDQLDPARFQLALNHVLVGAVNLIAEVVPEMQARSSGRVIYVIGRDGVRGRPMALAACTIEHGLSGQMRALARDVADRGVCVNAVVAGLVDTDRLAIGVDQIVSRTRRERAAVRADLAASNPQQRLIQPDEIGKAVAWLSQPGSAGITGQMIVVDGGELG